MDSSVAKHLRPNTLPPLLDIIYLKVIVIFKIKLKRHSKFLALMQNVLLELLNYVSTHVRRRIVFQHDEKPSYQARCVKKNWSDIWKQLDTALKSSHRPPPIMIIWFICSWLYSLGCIVYDTPIHSELNLQARMSFSVSAIDATTGILKNIANLCRIGTHPSMPIETISNSTCDACKSHVVLLLFYKHSEIKQNCSILIKNMFFFRMHCNFSINVLL